MRLQTQCEIISFSWLVLQVSHLSQHLRPALLGLLLKNCSVLILPLWLLLLQVVFALLYLQITSRELSCVKMQALRLLVVYDEYHVTLTLSV